MVFKKIIFQNRYVALETPSRPSPPFIANAILNFHFDFLTTSLILTVMMTMTIFSEQGLSSTCNLVHVQDQPWQVADDEDGDDQHQDDRHVVIFSTSTSHSPP